MGVEAICTEQQTHPPSGVNRIAVLDYARFGAAMMVLAYHWTYSSIARDRVTSIELIEPLAAVTRFGLLGVDLFFLISGYVIFYSAQNRTAAQFATARVVRLYPMFWVALILTTLACNGFGPSIYHVSWQTFLANLTMAAPVFGYPHVDWVYWTLLVELSFYAAVLVVLLLRLGGKLGWIVAIWPFVMLAGSAAGLGRLPLLGGVYFLFAAGALFAYLRETRAVWLVIPLAVCFVMDIRRATQRWPLFVDGEISWASVAGAGVIVAFFAFFVALNSEAVRNLKLPLSRILGAVSYPVYLLHALIGYFVIERFATDANKLAVWAGLLVTLLVVSWALHYAVEDRMGRVWRRLGAGTVGRGVGFVERVFGFRKSPAHAEPKSMTHDI